jgi:hypothetical protein
MAGQENTVPDYPRGVTFEQVWAPGIASRFNEMGYRFDSLAPGDTM